MKSFAKVAMFIVYNGCLTHTRLTEYGEDGQRRLANVFRFCTLNAFVSQRRAESPKFPLIAQSLPCESKCRNGPLQTCTRV